MAIFINYVNVIFSYWYILDVNGYNISEDSEYWKREMHKLRTVIGPSILSADFANLKV